VALLAANTGSQVLVHEAGDDNTRGLLTEMPPLSPNTGSLEPRWGVHPAGLASCTSGVGALRSENVKLYRFETSLSRCSEDGSEQSIQEVNCAPAGAAAAATAASPAAAAAAAAAAAHQVGGSDEETLPAAVAAVPTWPGVGRSLCGRVTSALGHARLRTERYLFGRLRSSELPGAERFSAGSSLELDGTTGCKSGSSMAKARSTRVKNSLSSLSCKARALFSPARWKVRRLGADADERGGDGSDACGRVAAGV
jgi:hypothetical protein